MENPTGRTVGISGGDGIFPRSFGTWEKTNTGKTGEYTISDYELICIVEGFSDISKNGEVHRASEGELLLLVALGVYIFFGIGAVPGETLADYIKPTADFVTLWGAVAILNYALQGGAAVAAFADEVENPSFTIPVSFFAGTGFVTLLYCVIAYVTYGLGPVEGTTGMDAYNLGVIAATFMSPLLVKFFIVCGALFATVTTLQSSLLLYSRMWYVSAKDGIWPKIFTRTNKYNVPWFALWFSTFCACVAILSGIQLSDVLKIVSIPGLLLGILFYYPCLAFLKRYPNAAKRSYLRVPTPVQAVL